MCNVPNRKGDPESRQSTIPLPEGHWWPAAAQAAVDARKTGKQPGWQGYADQLVKRGVPGANVDKVKRCVLGTHVTWEIAEPLSRLLDIPPPAFIAESREAAEAIDDPEILDETRRLIRRARDLADRLRAGADQSPPLQSADVGTGWEPTGDGTRETGRKRHGRAG
jgi:hypothetical protein